MAGLERIRFLVVDDNIHMINIVKTILRGFGATHIFEARDATEAFHRLKHDAIDVAIVDYMMDVLDGVEFVQLVRNSSDSANRYVPIIMLTAHSERARVLSARDAGVNEFCCKPVTALELHRKVEAIINHPRPFIKTNGYFGPDRRRHSDDKYKGKERRAGSDKTLSTSTNTPDDDTNGANDATNAA